MALIPALNGYRWLRGQNHYDTWYDSGVSGRAVRSFYDPPQAKACRDCHLPPYRSDEFGNRNGYLHDHLFPAANTALPFVREDAATQKQHPTTSSRTRSCRSTSSPCGAEAARSKCWAKTRRPSRPGETLDVEVVVRTRGVGHPYTNGTADSNETWVSLEAAAGGGRFFASGVLDADGRLDAAADRLSTLVIDHDGGHMDRRQPQDIRVPLYNNGIGPGRRARRPLPRSTSRRTRRARSRCRPARTTASSRRDYTTFSLGADAPVASGDDARERHGDASRSPGLRPPASRLGRAERQHRPALAALERLRHRPLPPGRPQGRGARRGRRSPSSLPTSPTGPLNRARAEIAEGRLADAKASLAEAEQRRPGWGKTAFFRATVAKDEGRLDEAEKDLKAVLEKFPLDRVAWNNLGLVDWLAGRFPDAIAAYGKTLAIDPEDLNAHYNLMRVYRATGDRRNADDPRRGLPQVQGRRGDPRDRRRLPSREPLRQPRVAAASTSTPRPSLPRAEPRAVGRERSGRRATRPTAAI